MDAVEIARLLLLADSALTATINTASQVQALLSRARSGQPVTDADIAALHSNTEKALADFRAAVAAKA